MIRTGRTVIEWVLIKRGSSIQWGAVLMVLDWNAELIG